MARSVSSMPPTCWRRAAPESSSVRRRGRPSCSDRASVMTSSTSRRARRAGIDVVKRRSGGGAVLVEPGAMCWFDVVVPADDRRFRRVAGDVGASMRWLGRHVATALGAMGVGDLAIHDGPMARGRVAELVCFAGLGPGEVLARGPQARRYQPAQDAPRLAVPVHGAHGVVAATPRRSARATAAGRCRIGVRGGRVCRSRCRAAGDGGPAF